MMRIRICLPLLLVILAVRAPSPAQDKPKVEPPPKESVVETRHSATIAGARVDYTATAGTLLLKDDDGKPTASIFFVAYNRVKVAEPPPPALGAQPGAVTVSPPDPARPITFAFNGGPGSSAVWLHLGALGPRRVALTDNGEPPPPPYKLTDNEFSVLDLTDLVFIDPVSTGFSRPAPGQDAKKFHGVEADIATIGEFIRIYLSRFNRWGSPKYVAGESYGTTRAAGLAAHLQDKLGINLNGVILVSAVLNFQTARFDDGNDLPYALFLPSYTATAHFHKKLNGDLQADLRKALSEAEQFATTEYTLALMKGDRLTAEDRLQLGRKLARYTGLSEDYVTRANYRIEISRFTKELLRDQARTVGRFDSRLKGTDSDSAGERHEYDPSYAAVQGAYTATLNQYLRRDLRYETDLAYEILTGRVQPWDFGDAKNRYLNVSNPLRSAMTKNRDLRVFVASGYFDLATPYFGTDYTVSHLGFDPELAKKISVNYYEAGHMMYIHKPSHEKLRKDLAGWFAGK